MVRVNAIFEEAARIIVANDIMKENLQSTNLNVHVMNPDNDVPASLHEIKENVGGSKEVVTNVTSTILHTTADRKSLEPLTMTIESKIDCNVTDSLSQDIPTEESLMVEHVPKSVEDIGNLITNTDDYQVSSSIEIIFNKKVHEKAAELLRGFAEFFPDRVKLLILKSYSI